VTPPLHTAIASPTSGRSILRADSGRAVLILERPILDPIATVVVVEVDCDTVERTTSERC